MATLQDLESSLIQAHQAGDKQSAQVLADEIRKMRASEPTTGERVARQAGLAVRGAVEGVTALPLLAGDALNEIYNLAVSGAEKVTGKDLPKLGKATDYVRGLLTKAGLPEPANDAEKVANAAISGMAGAGPIIGAGKALAGAVAPAVKAVGGVLSSAPGMQAASGATGAVASEVARQSDVGAAGQLAAGLAGAVAPAAATAAGAAAVRGVVRGGDSGRQQMAERLATFKNAGTEKVSVGQASGSRAIQATESGLSRTPGGAGVMVKAAEQQSDDMGARVGAIADELSQKASATKAGSAIESGLKSFVGRFKSQQDSLFNKLDQYIPPQKRVDVYSTRAALQELNADIPGAPNLSEWFKNSKIQGIERALEADITQQSAVTPSQLRAAVESGPQRAKDLASALEEGKLPYEAVKKLRSLVGRELENTSLASDVPRSKWKALYAALSEDLGVAAAEAGPPARRAFNRANDFTRAGHTRIETFLDRVGNKDTVEKIFNAAVNPSEIREGASTVNAVMRSIKPEERKVVQAAFIKRMGIATPGNNNELGDVFSAQTFLTNWNKISPEAKMTLFAGSKGNQLRQNLDQVAEASNMVREGARVFANPSGTQQAVSNQAVLATLGIGAITGNYGAVGAAVGGIAAANMSARLLTNQNFVKWLAETTTVSPGALPAQLNALVQTAQGEDKETRRQIGRYVRAVSQELSRQKTQSTLQQPQETPPPTLAIPQP